MAFKIPGEGTVTFGQQAAVMETDLEIIAAGYERCGVRSGCAVTAQGVPNMTVAVAAGVIENAGVPVTVAGGNGTITAAHATLDRIDVVGVVRTTGNINVFTGTPASPPMMPDADLANYVALAAVYVPATATSIPSNYIIDKRVILNTPKKAQVIRANQAGIAGGDAVFAAFGTYGSTYSMPDAAASTVGNTVHVPNGTYGLSSVKLRFSGNNTSTTSVRILVDVSWGTVGTTHTANTPAQQAIVQAMPGVAHQLIEVDATTAFGSTTIPAGAWVLFQVQRTPANASDTYPGTLSYHGAILEWNT